MVAPGSTTFGFGLALGSKYKEFGSFLDHRERDPLTSHSFSSLEIRTRNRRPPASCGSEEFEVS